LCPVEKIYENVYGQHNEPHRQKIQIFLLVNNKTTVHRTMVEAPGALPACMKRYIVHCKDCAAGDADQRGNSSSVQFKPKA
jgi:hypothetical protein